MKMTALLFGFTLSFSAYSQEIQLHYDFRHSIDPELHRRNFPALSFEYFRSSDSTGAFLLKMQADFHGEKSQIGQVFLQITKDIPVKNLPVLLSLNYTGGLGVVPPSFGYSIANSFGAGAAYPFSWKGAWLSVSLSYRYNAFPRASHDAQCNFYFGRGFFNYRLFVAGSFVAFTRNRNLGNMETMHLRGKVLAMYGDPQIWLKVRHGLSLGTRINLYYHILTESRGLQGYPTLALRYQFNP